MRIERCFEEAMVRLQADDVRRDRGEASCACTPDQRLEAERRLRSAYHQLRNSAFRARKHAGISRAGSPVTHTLRCPIDVAALREYAASTAGDVVISSRKKHHSHMLGKTQRAVIEELLAAVTLDAVEPGIGFIDIEYTHAKRTAALIATGWLTDGRVYAKGADPFKLTRELRSVALRRFGFDLDMGASHTRAAYRAIPLHRQLAGVLLSGQNREDILQGLGDILCPAKSDAEKRKIAKQLLLCVDMDGSAGGWLAEKKADGTLDADAGFGPDPRVALRDGSTFPVRQYFAEQPQRTQWLADRCKPILALIDHWRRIEGGSSEPARTLKSDVLCEWEAIAREAMLRWAVHEAHDILSLQHDGAVFALRPDVAVADACRELEAACGGAVLATRYRLKRRT